MHHSEFTLPASNGYRLQVTETGNRQIYLTAKNGGSSVIYAVRGRKAAQDGIEAKLPGVGRISMHFEQVGKTKHSPPIDNCEGDGSDTERGVFRGTVVFNGEKGFTRARAHRVSGTVHDSAKETCRREKEGKGNPSFHTTLLTAVAPRGKGLLSFFAAKFSSDSTPTPEQTAYSASLIEFKGPMSISRTVSQVASGESFTLGHSAWNCPASARSASPARNSRPNSALTVGPATAPAMTTTPTSTPWPSTSAGESGWDSGQRLPVPGLGRGEALLVKVVPELR